MLRNYLLVALRGLRRNRSASIINILGLSIGLACFILITVYVANERSYDRFHTNAKDIYRFTTIDEALGVSSNNVAITNPRMPLSAMEELPEVVNATRMLPAGRTRIEHGEDVHYSEDTKYVEKNFFEIFDYEVSPGTYLEDFHQPRKMIMTSTMALNTFGTTDVAGEVVTIDDEDWEVIGVMQDVQENSHLRFDVFLSMYPTEADSSFAQYMDSWSGLGMVGYAQLQPGAIEKDVEAKLYDLTLANDVNDFWIPQLQPLTEIHLGSTEILFDNYHVEKGDRVYVYSLSAVALFVLLIAAFNFMNLSTAKSSTRAKEVGIRKVMGGARSNLVAQHLGESVLLVLMATAFALVMVIAIAPMLNLGLPLTMEAFLFDQPELLLFILGSAIVIGLLSGLYPAFILSGYQTSSILRGKFSGSQKGVNLRKALVVMQFTASIVMIIGTVFIVRQIQFIKNKDLGFSKDQVVTFEMSDPGMSENMVSFRDELMKHEGVKASALSANMPGRTFGRAGIRPEGAMEDGDEMWIVSVFNYDHYYLDLMGMEIVDGRNFSPESGDEENGVMVNEAFVAQIGWDDPIGKQVRMGGGDQYRSVVGVVKDFHFADMKHVIEPLIMFYNPGANNNVSFRIGGGEIEATMQVAEGIWSEVYPEYPFEYEFFDEEFDQLYRSDERFSSLVMNFTWLAIFIACMGLFGLSAFMADQRKKEIGVRKVLGSSVQQVVLLLSREFIVLISIATLIAWPIAYFAVENWLGEFQYRIELLSGANIVIFIVAGLVALGIGLVTVGYQSRAAAIINPVNSLKEE